ncbi:MULTISPECIES: DUF1376 domain-containing protein [unclassified Sphingobium]|uniref:DUF1376 domain-containing protein n=1 Tax=unclassified Sphingobium TaxID=2611147 RepID=UPI000D155DB1|nr:MULTISPECIES: DUF1376 domain-containing protein [unclassified Sphingobium]PSO12617.1 hypothetical protein C7E20_05785 [Sphingobium sp. AEW4]TWD09798.1 uncharacterized protein DUF1376 [Sphingobium sp. AEW010]TWD26469.1 uncharacterized protein DUF1376 [Sphingobium sp. AEW013]TWD27762.1 uncharacterized protein DUF1376 [Sphingobium sp. AEW001]
MSAQHWHKRYHSDALTGFMSLTLEERGAYQTILDLIYDRGGPIVDNDRLLAGYMGVSLRKWAALRDTLISKGKISIEDGQITNARAIFELEKSSKTSRKLAENGSKGGCKSGEIRKKPNENSETDEARLKPGSSHTRYQKPEAAKAAAHAMPELMVDLCQIAGIEPPDPGIRFNRHKDELDTVGRWIGQGAAPALIRQVVTKRCATLRKPPHSLAYFDNNIREAISSRSTELGDTERQALAILQRADQVRHAPSKGLHS